MVQRLTVVVSPIPFFPFLSDGMEAQKLWLDIPNEVTFRWHFFIEDTHNP